MDIKYFPAERILAYTHEISYINTHKIKIIGKYDDTSIKYITSHNLKVKFFDVRHYLTFIPFINYQLSKHTGEYIEYYPNTNIKIICNYDN